MAADHYSSNETAMPVVNWPIDKPRPYPHNPRRISDLAIAKVAASIREFGFRQPIVVDGDGVVIAGHTRLAAASSLGLASVPVHVAADLTPAMARAYRLADNRSGEEAEWDNELLRVEMAALAGLDIDLSLTAFDPDEIAGLSGHQGLVDPDEVPEAPSEPITQPGDVWQLGPHRLVCGDATNADDVARVLGGVQPHLMVTDPPYGVEYNADWRNNRFRGAGGPHPRRALRAAGSPIAGRAIGPISNDHQADWREAWWLFPGDVAYVWHAGLRARQVIESLEAASFKLRAQIIWSKGRFVISRGDYHFQHEACWYAVRNKAHWQGDRSQTTIWQIDHQKSETGHSAQKPVECMKRPIENNSSPGQAVYDPFVGSGTTIIAAEMIGRACHALEIAPAYCDVTVERWQNFTGRKAERVGRAAAA
jgi:DNA modification methylase